MSHTAFDYQYTEEETHWDWNGCHFEVEIPYPCGIKYKTVWGRRIPWGIKWCWSTVSIPYPCFVTTILTKTGHACKGTGKDIWQLHTSLYNTPPAKIPDLTLPRPDYDNNDGDILYAVYRRGLITRHITKNGRVLPKIGLESIDDFDSANYDFSGYISITRSDNSTYRIPIGNIRYSLEFTSDPSFPSPSNRLWVPVIAPVKNPGNSNGGRYVISGNDDNPIYYGGGLALATFSLEALYGVSKYSIEYARRLILYFLHSEMWQGNGYIIRRTGFFNSNRNGNGEPVIQGASLEELLGLMLGIMFYLKAERVDHPLFQEAVRLRDDVLGRVSQGHIWDYYEHSFMISAVDRSYWVKHFEFPLYASKEYDPGTWIFDEVEQLYINFLTLAAGRTRTVGGWFGDLKFEQYMMYLTSMILVLEGNIPEDKKVWFAEVYMRDFIKASTTHGPDIDALKGNLYMALLAKLSNKYLNDERDSEYESDKLKSIWKSIWGDDYGSYRDLVSPLEVPIQSLATNMPKPPGTRWQPNLPFACEVGESYGGWYDHNVRHGIGGHFIWRYPNESYYWRADKDKWISPFAGYGGTVQDWLDFGAEVDEATFKSGVSKKYTSPGYLQKELIQARQHKDNQNEGAGLDLLFMRMFLTHINPTAYPPPKLPAEYDKQFPVLPFPGAEPLDPILMYKTFEHVSKDDPCGSEAIQGDQDKALRILKLGEEHLAARDFVIAYATDDENLKLKHGFLSNGSNPMVPEGIYIDSKGTVWKRFDKATLKWTENDNHDNILVVAERAEGDITLEFSTDIFRRKHWLRLSVWRVPPFGGGGDPNPVLLDTWRSDEEDADAFKDLDMAILDRAWVVVLFRTKRDKDRIAIFRIDFSTNRLIEAYNGVVNEDTYDESLAVTTAYRDIVIYTYHGTDGWQITSGKWTGSTFEDRYKYQAKSRDKLIDITTVRKLDRADQDFSEGKDYVVVVRANGVRNDGYPREEAELPNYLAVDSYEVQTDGSLVYKGTINTVGKYDGERSLAPREGDWERGSVESFYPTRSTPGFVISGKGVGRELRDKKGKWKRTPKGLKVVYGYLLPDGRPTLETSNLAGSGDSSAMSMLDVTSTMTDEGDRGIITVNKTKAYGGFLGFFSDYYMTLRFWKFVDSFTDSRWSQ